MKNVIFTFLLGLVSVLPSVPLILAIGSLPEVYKEFLVGTILVALGLLIIYMLGGVLHLALEETLADSDSFVSNIYRKIMGK